MTTKELSDKELEIFNFVRSLRGTIDEIRDVLREKATSEKYKIIHSQYLEIIRTSTDQNERTEALKRSVFLNWYQIIEPDFFTGIESLDGDTVYETYSVLNDYLKNKSADEELIWMLSFYSFNEYAILMFCKEDMPSIVDFVSNVDRSRSYIPDKNKLRNTMAGRGQMGIYFKS